MMKNLAKTFVTKINELIRLYANQKIDRAYSLLVDYIIVYDFIEYCFYIICHVKKILYLSTINFCNLFIIINERPVNN